MANANPSSPGRTESARVRPEQNIPKDTKVVKVNGKSVLQTEMTNGNIRNTNVFPGDYDSKGKKVAK